MAQAFTTIYAKDYKWRTQEPRHRYGHPDKFSESLPEGDMWIEIKNVEEEFGKEGLGAAEALVRKMYIKRYITTYRDAYCRQWLREQGLLTIPEPTVEEENELLAEIKELYRMPKDAKIIPPLPTSRRIFGYMKPARMYTPLTTYQDEIGHLGFEILRGVLPKEQHKAHSYAPDSKQVQQDVAQEVAAEMAAAEQAETAALGGGGDVGGEAGQPLVAGSTGDGTQAPGSSGDQKLKRKKSKKIIATATGMKAYKYWDNCERKMICTCTKPSMTYKVC